MKTSEAIRNVIGNLLAEVESLRALEKNVLADEAIGSSRPGKNNTRADRFVTGSFAARIVWFLTSCAPDEGLPAQTIGAAIDNPNLRSVRSLCYDLETRGHLKLVSPGRFVATRKGVRTYEVVGVTRTPVPPPSALDAFLGPKRTPTPAPALESETCEDLEMTVDEDGLDLDDLPDLDDALQDEPAAAPEKFTAKRALQLAEEYGDTDEDDENTPRASTLSDEEFARAFGATIEKKE